MIFCISALHTYMKNLRNMDKNLSFTYHRVDISTLDSEKKR